MKKGLWFGFVLLYYCTILTIILTIVLLALSPVIGGEKVLSKYMGIP
jgi:hypothetical protein